MSKRHSLYGRNHVSSFFSHDQHDDKNSPKPFHSKTKESGRVFRVVKDSQGNTDAVPLHQVKTYLES